MRIHATCCGNNVNKCNNINFNGLIKDPSVLPIIKDMTDKDKLELKKIEKRFSKTRFWDIKISSIGNAFKEFKYQFLNKNNSKNVITDGIYPYYQKGRNIGFYSIVYGPENTSLNTIEILRFNSQRRAKKLYDEYQQNILYARNIGHNISPIESLKMKEIELKMLEESSKATHGKRNVTRVNTELKTKSTTGNDLK